MLTFAYVFPILKKIAMITVPIPLFVIVIVAIWFHFDKQSAIKQAIVKLVAEAELKAKDAIIESKETQLKFIQQANVRQARRLEIEQQANNDFKIRIDEITATKDEFKDKLNEIVSKRQCNDVVDSDFIKLLQSDQ